MLARRIGFIGFHLPLSLLILLAYGPCAGGAQPPPPAELGAKNVLILHAFEANAPLFQETDRALGATLRERGVPALSHYYEFLDLRRYPDPGYRRLLVERLRVQFRDRRFDLIITMYPEALDFLLHEGSWISPGAPVLALYLPADPGPSLGDRRIFHHTARLDPLGTVEVALRLVPGAKRVYVASGAHPSDKLQERLARHALQALEGRLEFHYLSDRPLQEALTTLARAPHDAIVLLLPYSHDAAGVSFLAQDLTRQVSQASAVPVFGLLEVGLGYGIVGGSLFSFERVGVNAGRLALELLRGSPPAGEPVLNVPGVPMFDWRQLTRWHLSVDALPPGSIVINREYTLWERYRWQATGAIALLAVQALLILALLVHRQRRRRAEETLRENEERLRLALNAAALGVWSWDIPRGRIRLSEQLGRMLPATPTAEVDYQDALAIVHPEDRERIEAARQEAIRTRTEYEVEYRIPQRDGTVRWIASRGSCTYDKAGAPLRMTGVSHDVTERKRAEAALHESEERFRQVAENVADFIWEVDAEGLYRYTSPSVEKILGYRPEELVGKVHFYDLFVPEVRDELKAATLGVFAAKQAFRAFPNPNLSKDGRVVHLETSGAPVLDAAGKLVGYRGADTDVTERKGAERKLAEQLRIETILAEVSARFVHLPARQIEEEIQEVQRRICEVLDLDRSTLWQVSEGEPGSMLLTHFHMASAIPSIPDRMDARDFFPWSLQRVMRGETLTFSTLAALPPEAARDRESFQQIGTKADVIIPLVAGGAVFGALTFAVTRGEREWPEDVVRGFQIVAEVIANALTRRRADQALQESEQRFRHMADSAPVMVWMSGVDKGCTYFNKRWLDFTGRTMEEERGDGWAAGVHPEDRERCLAIYARAFNARKEFELEYRLRRCDGAYRWILDIGVPRFEGDGRFAGYIGSCLDITERRRAEEALRQSEAVSGGILTSLAGQMAILDRTGVIVRVNDAWDQFSLENGAPTIAGLSVGANYLEVCRRAARSSEPSAQVALEGIEAVLAGAAEEFTLEYPCHSPLEERWFAMRVTPLKQPEGGAVISHVNITARKVAELEAEGVRRDLAHATRVMLMGELTASLAHELNQPLTAIVSNAQAGERFLAGKSPSLQDVREILADVVADATRAGEVIRQIRGLVKKGEVEFAPLDLNGIIQEVVVLARTDAIVRKVAVVLELASSLPPVHGDKTQLQQVLLNLILNGLEAMEASGADERTLVIRTVCEDAATVRVGVQDFGPGIPPERQTRIFEPFYTTKATGMGMGLSVTRSIVGTHGGTIWAENNPERGATFWFSLPVHHAPAP